MAIDIKIIASSGQPPDTAPGDFCYPGYKGLSSTVEVDQTLSLGGAPYCLDDPSTATGTLLTNWNRVHDNVDDNNNSDGNNDYSFFRSYNPTQNYLQIDHYYCLWIVNKSTAGEILYNVRFSFGTAFINNAAGLLDMSPIFVRFNYSYQKNMIDNPIIPDIHTDPSSLLAAQGSFLPNWLDESQYGNNASTTNHSIFHELRDASNNTVDLNPGECFPVWIHWRPEAVPNTGAYTYYPVFGVSAIY